MVHYKVNVLEALKQRGYSSTRLRNEKILSESTMQKLRTNNSTITADTLNTICVILRCQPGDIIEVIPTNDEKIKYF